MQKSKLRISQATQVHSSSVPQAKGVRKDHKENDPIFCPPIRMLMDGKKGPNAPLANITSRVLRPVRQNLNEKIQTEAISTEEICHHFMAHNQKVMNEPEVRRQPRRGRKCPPLQNSNMIIGSMDVKGLYPSCKIEKSCSNIEKAFRMTGLEFQNIDAQFLVKLVSVITRGQHSDPEIKKFLLKPKPRTSLNSILKRSSMNQFHGPPEKDFNELTGPQINTLGLIYSEVL